MLPAAHRLRRPDEFRTVLRGRQGRRRLPRARAGGELMTVHLVRRPDEQPPEPRIGFVVSKAVGNAVVRNRTHRRLRHLVAAQLDRLPPGSEVVVRAHRAAAAADSGQLAAELDRLLGRALRSVEPNVRATA